MDEELVLTSSIDYFLSWLRWVRIKVHSLIFPQSLLSSEELIVMSRTTEKVDVPSAKSLQFDDKPSGKSFI